MKQGTHGYAFYGHENASAVKAKNKNYPGIQTPLDLYDALSGLWSADTCAPRMREQWSPENPTLGQCSITAFLAQDIFGGEVRGLQTENGNTHCYNVVDGVIFDLTSEQFQEQAGTLIYQNDPLQERESAEHFGKEEKRLRYEMLKGALAVSCRAKDKEQVQASADAFSGNLGRQNMGETIIAIVLAAGQGKRMHSSVQKQYLLLGGKPLICYALHTFQSCDAISRIILVTGEAEIPYCQTEIVEKYGFDKVTDIVAGGAERYDSVEHALQLLDDGIVLIHDGARPFVTQDMIRRSIETVRQTGACTVGMPVKDTIKVADPDGYGIETPDRRTLWQIQTPQTFRTALIKEAYVKMRQSQATGITDDTMLVERYCGTRVKLIEGSYQNIKITTPEDMTVAEGLLKDTI